MDQYLSTYTKDYVWPPAKKSLAPTAGRAESFCEGGPCACGAEPGGYTTPRDYGAIQVGENCQWSRLDPMGPLLDPKLYPAKMGPGPECDVTRYDQPDTYMRKLQEKYPYIYNVLRGAPSDDINQVVNEDRLRTTYQVDYGHVDEHPTANYDNPPAEAGFSSGCSKNAPLDCRAHVRPPNYGDRGEEHHAKNGYGSSGGFGNGTNGFGGSREAAPHGGGGNGRAATSGGAANGSGGPRGGATNGAGAARGAQGGSAGGARSSAVKAMRSGGATGKKGDIGADTEKGKRGGDSEAPNVALPAWMSEYNEVIGQTGFDIVKDKIHQHGGKSPGRIFMEKAVMRCRNHT